MTLEQRLAALATRIGNHIRDSVLPRLLPSGGTAGQVLAKSSASDFAVGWVNQSGGGGGGQGISILNFHADATANLTLTNQPNSEQGLGNSNRNEIAFDATNFAEVRVVARVVTAGAATARLYPQFSTNGTSFTTIGSGSGAEAASLASAAAVKSDWVALPVGAKADVIFRIAQNGGNATADPALGAVALQFR